MSVYGKDDAVMGKGKDRDVNSAFGCRPCLQRRQNPHAAPARSRLRK